MLFNSADFLKITLPDGRVELVVDQEGTHPLDREQYREEVTHGERCHRAGISP
jgi:hypothetical protein